MVGGERVDIMPRAFFVGTDKDRVSDQHLHQIDNTLPVWNTQVHAQL